MTVVGSVVVVEETTGVLVMHQDLKDVRGKPPVFVVIETTVVLHHVTPVVTEVSTALPCVTTASTTTGLVVTVVVVIVVVTKVTDQTAPEISHPAKEGNGINRPLAEKIPTTGPLSDDS